MIDLIDISGGTASTDALRQMMNEDLEREARMLREMKREHDRFINNVVGAVAVLGMVIVLVAARLMVGA